MKLGERKAALRGEMRGIRREIDERQRARGSAELVQRLVGLPAMRHARSVAVYLACGSELSLAPVVAELQRSFPETVIAYPVLTSTTDMVFVRYFSADGVLPDHPTDIVRDVPPERIVETGDLDIWLVPGLAFDEQGRRLGQGGGFYDRALAHAREEALVIGIAFDEQIVESVPAGELDRRVDYVLTPTRLIST